MSLWHCETHGLTGPMACCGKAGRATIAWPAGVVAPPSVLTTTAPVKWWESAALVGPFTPTGEGGNDGIVRDGRGEFVADTRGYEARADVIAELLNRAVEAYHDERVAR